MDLTTFRQENPQFDDVDSFKLAQQIYKSTPSFQQSGVTFEEFSGQFGVEADIQARKPEGEGITVGDFGRSVAIGLSRVGQTMGRALDVAGLDETGQRVEEFYKGREVKARMEQSPEYKAEMAKRFLDKGEEGETIMGKAWTSPVKIAGMLTESAPQTVIGMGAGYGITKSLIKLGVSSGLAGIVGGAIGEGGVAGVEAAKETYDVVMNAPIDQLSQTPEFQGAFRDNGGDLEAARESTAQKAMWATGSAVGATTAMLGAPSGYGIGKIVGEGGKTLPRTILRQAALEAVQETPQSAAEQYAMNVVEQRYVDPEIDAGEDVGEAAIAGGVSGFFMGGALGGAAYRPRVVDPNEPQDLLNPESDLRPPEPAPEPPVQPVPSVETYDQSVQPEPATVMPEQQIAPEQQRQVEGERIREPIDRPPASIPPPIPAPKPDMIPGEMEPVDIEAHEAATSPLNEIPEPTEPQKEAGNYKVGKVKIEGMDISIENPAGSQRTGKDKDGEVWSTDMNHHYGYIRGTIGKDKDHIDTFVNPGNETSPNVYVVDQVNPETGDFDEHKVMIGFDSQETAQDAYLSNYEEGWQGLGNITEVPIDEFKQWALDGKRKTQPYAKEVAERPPVSEAKVITFDNLPDYAKGAIASDAMGKGKNAEDFIHSKWVPETVSIDSLKSKNKDVFGDKFVPRGSMTKGPIVVSSDGVVLDGNNRLHEAFLRNDKTIDVLKEKALKPEPAKIVEEEPEVAKKPTAKGEKVRTVRGRIKAMGNINFGKFTGELKSMVTAVKFLSKKAGVPFDLAEETLKEEGWLREDESLLDLLRDAPTETLRRGKVGVEITDKREEELTPVEKQVKAEMEYEPEEPPEGEYITMNAEDLPEGKELTIIDGLGARGWDVYEVTESDPFSVTLKDGREIELASRDRVRVLKKNVVEPEVKPIPKEQDLLPPEKPKMFDEPEPISQPKRKRERKEKVESKFDQARLPGMGMEQGRLPEKEKIVEPVGDLEAEIDRLVEKQAKEIILTKKQKAAQEYQDYVASLTDEQKELAGDLVEDEPKFPGGQMLKIKKVLAKPAEVKAPIVKGREIIPSFKGLEKVIDSTGIKKAIDTMRGIAINGGRRRLTQKEYAENLLSPKDDPDAIWIKEGDYNAIKEFVENVSETVISAAKPGKKVRGINEILSDVEDYALNRLRPDPATNVNSQSAGIHQAPRDFKKLTGDIGLERKLPEPDFVVPDTESPKDTIIGFEARIPQNVIDAFIKNFSGVEGYWGMSSGFSYEDPDGQYTTSTNIRIKGVSVEAVKKILSEHTEKPKAPELKKEIPAGEEKARVDLKKVAAVKKAEKKLPEYAVQKEPTAGDLTIDDIRSAFPDQEVGLDKNKDIWVRTKSGHGVTIKSVQDISVNEKAFQIGYSRAQKSGEVITGTYQDGVIRIVKGIGGKWTLHHESTHWMEDVQILNKLDTNVLDNAIKKADFGKGRSAKEKRASYIEYQLESRDWDRNTVLGRVMQKIADLFDGLVNLVKQTARGIVRGIETGKVFDRDVGDRVPYKYGEHNTILTPSSEIKETKVKFVQQELPIGKKIKPVKVPGKVQPPEQRVRMETTGTIKASGNVANNSADVASLLAHIRKEAQENAYSVAVDKDGVVVEIHKYGKGTKGEASINIIEIAGRTFNAKDVDKVYFVHNHPSGKTTGVSEPDRDISRRLEAIFKLKDIASESFVITGTKWVSIGVSKSTDSVFDIRPTVRKVSLQEKERRLTRPPSFKDRRVVENRKQFLNTMKRDYGDKEGILFLDSSNTPVGFMAWPKGKETRKAAVEIFARAEFHNATGAIIRLKDVDDGRIFFIRSLIQSGFDTGFIPHDVVVGDMSIDDIYPDDFRRDEYGRFIMGDMPGRGLRALDSPEILYSVKKTKQEKKFEKTFFKDTLDLYEDWKKKDKPDTADFDRFFSLLSHHAEKVPPLKELSDAGQGANEDFHAIVTELAAGPGRETLLARMQLFKKNQPKEYEKLRRYFEKRDMNKIGYEIEQDGDDWNLLNLLGKTVATYTTEKEAEAEMVRHEMIDAKKAGYSDQALSSIEAVRTMTIRGFDKFMAPMRSMIAKAEEKAVQQGYDVRQDEKDKKFYVHKGLKRNPGWFDSAAEAWGSVLDLPKVAFTEADGTKAQISFPVALAKMGDMRGYYMPRIRNPGRLVLIATKKGENPVRKQFELGAHIDPDAKGVLKKALKTLFNAAIPGGIGRTARRLRKDGYKVTLEKMETIQEDTFELLGPMVAMYDIINKALEETGTITGISALEDMGMKGKMRKNKEGGSDYILTGAIFKQGYDDALKSLGGEYSYRQTGKYGTPQWKFKDAPGDIEQQISQRIFEFENITPDFELKFASMFAEQVANIIKGRGARAHMIRREAGTGKDVWIGYETDPLEAIGKYVRGIAASEAKKKLAVNFAEIYTGTREKWIDYKVRMEEEGKRPNYEAYKELVRERSIESHKQKNAAIEAKSYMKHMLRNQETPDRMIGYLQGAAVLKFLGFRVSAPIINMTVLPTAAIATMKGYAGIPMRKAPALMVKAMKYYSTYQYGDKKFVGEVVPKELPEDIRKVFEEIDKKGWLNPQYDRETLTFLRSTVGQGWDKAIDASMLMFSVTEKINRASVIMGSYIGIKEMTPPGEFDHDEALRMAKEASDKANGVYGKANHPYLARGANPAAQAMKAFYVFKTFSHTYLLTMLDLGFSKGEAKAALWMLFSPVILAGVGASAAMPVIAMIANMFGYDDPEEWFYDNLKANFGEYAERIGRFGVFGAAGINIKSSLAIETGVNAIPTNFKELFGAPGSVGTDLFDAAGYAIKGDYMKSFEKAMPLAIGNPMKAFREYTEGVTTRRNAPVFYGNEQLKADELDAFLRMLSFNPARMAQAREKQWAEKKMMYSYRDDATDIYSKFRKFFLQPAEDRTKENLLELVKEVQIYNQRIIDKGHPRNWMITERKIVQNLKRSFRPSKVERRRAA